MVYLSYDTLWEQIRIFFPKNTVISFFITLLLFLTSNTSEAKEYSKLFIPRQQSLEVVVNINKTDKEHARNNIRIKKIGENDVNQYYIQSNGSGDYGKYKNVSWEKEAVVKEDKNHLKTIYSQMIIKDKKGDIVAHYKNSYDYENGLIEFEKSGKSDFDYIKKEFSLKGPVCDDVTMIHFLKNYTANLGKKGFNYFYLLTNEPKLYKVKIKEIGKDILIINNKRKESVKLQLMADLGPLTDISAKVVPPTYVWYENKAPFNWLQYEGMDLGFRSENVKATLIKEF